MGKKNNLLNQYLEKAEIFAEFCNAVIYGGQTEIRAQDLAEAQQNYARMKRGRDGVLRSRVRERDVIKLLCRTPHFVKIALENQDSLHFGMPLRCREYDDMELVTQFSGLKRQHRAAKDLKEGPEYLSGIAQTDRLIPVITIVFYHGREKWTAARKLTDMLDMAGIDGKMRKLVPDYQMNLVCLEDLQEEHFRTGLRDLIALMKRREDREAMGKYLAENQDRLEHLDSELYDLLCVMLNLGSLRKRKEKYYNEETEDYRMCTAFREMLADSRKEGRQEGIEIGEKRGIAFGEQRLSMLIERLTHDNRHEDILHVCADASVRQQLYLEYGL